MNSPKGTPGVARSVAADCASVAVGKTIEAIETQGHGAFFIVQINRRDGEAVTRPEGSTVIQDGDGVVLVGRGAQSNIISALFEAGGRSAFRVSAR